MNNGINAWSRCKSSIEIKSPILEVGCGNGRLCELLSKQGYDICGIDITTFNYSRIGYKYIAMDITKLWPFKDNQFKLALSFDVAEHIEEYDLDIMLNEMCRVSNQRLLKIAHGASKYRPIQLHVTQRSKQWWIDKLQCTTESEWKIIDTIKQSTIYWSKI